jgi:hypothetical protein
VLVDIVVVNNVQLRYFFFFNRLVCLLNRSVCSCASSRVSTSLLVSLLGTLSTHARLTAESGDTSGTSLLWRFSCRDHDEVVAADLFL